MEVRRPQRKKDFAVSGCSELEHSSDGWMASGKDDLGDLTEKQVEKEKAGTGRQTIKKSMPCIEDGDNDQLNNQTIVNKEVRVEYLWVDVQECMELVITARTELMLAADSEEPRKVKPHTPIMIELKIIEWSDSMKCQVLR